MAQVTILQAGKIRVLCPSCDTAVIADRVWHRFDQPRCVEDILAVCHNPMCQKPILLRIEAASDVFQNTPAIGSIHAARILPAAHRYYDEQAVPEQIRIEFQEALQCQSAGHRLGAALVGRRVLQAAVRNCGGKGKDLQSEIDSLDNAILTPMTKHAAHEIRLIGNDAAHADPVSQVDTDDLLDFVDLVLQELYVRPARLAASRRRREEAKEAAKNAKELKEG